MPLSQSEIYNRSLPLIEMANDLDISVLEELRKVTNRLVDNPDQDFTERIRQFADQQSTQFVQQGQEWTEEALSAVYVSGIRSEDEELSQLGATGNEGNPVPPPKFPQKAIIIGTASEVARRTLKNYPEHLSTYSPYENTLKTTIGRSAAPYNTSSVQAYRNIAAEAISPAFRAGDRATRIDLSQRILDRFAKKGLETVEWMSGHRMSIEVFAEREARAYINNVAMQSRVGRAQERGYDLVRITQYAGASPMCEPHQGKVYSLSENSDQYPPFSDALFDGSWTYGSGIGHMYCGHQPNTYIPGVSEALGPLSNDPYEKAILNEMGEAKGNRHIFKVEQQQRYYERQIRASKRERAVAVSKSMKQKADVEIRNWQARQREWIDQNKFLRRRYAREAI